LREMTLAHESKRAVFAALVANLAIAVFKITAALISGSSSMLAEGYHSISDTFNQVLLLIGIRRAHRAPDRNHPFGHGKAQFFWAFLVAVILFGVAGTLSIREGIHKLNHPEPISHLWLNYLAIFFGLVFEFTALRLAVKSLVKERLEEHHKSFWQAVRQSKNPVTLTVLFEDSLAIFGLLIAALGITLVWLTKNLVFDAAASILIGALLMGFALFLALETKKLLLGEAVTAFKRAKILAAVQSFPEVERVVSLKTMHLSPDEVLITLELNYRDELNIPQLEELNDRIETAILALIPRAQIYLEAENLR
jgi:cation diffusion facilitator family transporter